MFRLLAVMLAALLAMACGEERASSPTAATAPAVPATAAATPEPTKPVKSGHEGHDHAKRAERPLPAFGGWTIEDKRLEIASMVGKRLLIAFFNPEVKEAAPVLEALASVSKLRGKHNFNIVGVGTGSKRETVAGAAKQYGLSFPIIDDSNGRIAGSLGLRSPMALIGVDNEGYVIFGITQFPMDVPDATARIDGQIRSALRLPGPGEADGALASRPDAPTFSAKILDGGEFDLAAHRGQSVVVIFFLHTCPHCHELLRFLKKQMAELPENQRPVLAGIEVTGRTHAVRAMIQKEGFDFLPVLFDDDNSIRSAYGVFAGVPDTFGIDAQGRIAWRVQGWRPETDGPLTRMRLARLAGAPVPMLLRAEGYSGNEVCGVCHEPQHETWQFTRHAGAFDTLVKHGASTNAECVGCHVVGYEQTGGFETSQPMPHLEDVGCETCHGRGGPHLSPQFVKDGDYEPACLACHDTKHSLGFEYATFSPRISHAENAKLLALPADQRERILEERGAVRKELLPTRAAHVGSEACKSCHPSEYETWSGNPHAGTLATLTKAGKQDDAACLACHTTGFGRDGGFPDDALPGDHPDLARVGCESCHGPGGDHVKDEATRLGTILSLGDKCDSCVILQICGSCHDEANDPGFEFEVQDKIDRIRHGTIEAGTGRKLEPGERSASLPTDPTALNALAGHILALSDADRATR